MAEGAGESLMNEAKGDSKDQKGEAPAFGLYLKDQIEKYYASKGKQVRREGDVCP